MNKKKVFRFIHNTEFSLIVIIVAMFVFFAAATPSFFTSYNLSNLCKQGSIIGIIAISATIVILTGGIDLSLGSMTGMSSLIVALVLTKSGIGAAAAILLAILSGGICGLFNGVIIKEFNVAPFIATMGTSTIVRGLIKVISQAKTIAGIDKSFSAFASGNTLFLPNLTWIWILMVIFGFVLLRYTRFGRNLYVIGSGTEVARLCGINLRWNTYAVYTLSGLLCGISGVMLTCRINSAVPTGGTGYDMSAIAATVIGGASLAGAKGTIIGTVLGTILMTLIDNGGVQLGIDPFIMEISTGALIIIAVIIDQFRSRKERK